MNAVKERPILFSAPMVRAILEGRKTVTRRVVKDWQVPTEDVTEQDPDLRWSAIAQSHPCWGFIAAGATAQECADDLASCGVCPYGKRGERLWVREAWAADAQLDSIAPRDLSQGEPIWYPADGTTRQTGCAMISKGRGRPSIHMPRWASRILLEITDVRVERLQAISIGQICKEGLARSIYEFIPVTTAFEAFAEVWDAINGDGAWDANPWVWVVEFKQVTKDA